MDTAGCIRSWSLKSVCVTVSTNDYHGNSTLDYRTKGKIHKPHTAIRVIFFLLLTQLVITDTKRLGVFEIMKAITSYSRFEVHSCEMCDSFSIGSLNYARG